MRFTALALAAFAAATLASAQDVHVHVDPNGPGGIDSATDYKTIQQALDHAPQPPAPYRLWIEIAPGSYSERVKVTRNRPRVTLLGLGKTPADTAITWSLNARQAGGTFFSAITDVEGDAFEADNITFANTAGNTGQAVAIAVRSDKAVFKHCRFLGDQDTLFADFGRQFYTDSFITGGVDFIFGNAAAVFDRDEIAALRPGYYTAQSRTAPGQPTGYVFDHSTFTTAYAPQPGADPGDTRQYLGRPWRPYARVIVMNSTLPLLLNKAGWSLWHTGDLVPPQAFYAEYNNTGPGAPTAARATWSHQLTAKEAAAYEPQAFLRGDDNWDPIAAAAALP